MSNRNQTETGQDACRSNPRNPEMNTLTEARQIYQDLLDAQMELRLKNEELNRALKDLEKTREKHQNLIENAPGGYLFVDMQGRIREVNQTFTEMFGLERLEILGKHFDELPRTPWYGSLKGQRDWSGIKHSMVEEHEFRKPDGSVLWIRMIFIRLSEDEVSILIVNITEQREKDRLIRINEEKYRTLVEHQNELVVKVDANGLFLYVSPSYCRTFGISEEELIGKSFMPLIHPDDVPSTQSAMEELYKPPHTCYVEQRAKTTDGWRWLAWSDRAVMSEKGDIDYIIGVGRDVTERRMAEEKVSKNEEQFKSILDLLPEVVIVHQNGTIVFANRMATRLSGYSWEELIGKDMLAFVAEKDRDMVITNFEKMLNGERVREYELELKTKNGIPAHAIIRSSDIVFNGRKASIIVLADVTARKMAENKLHERMKELNCIYQLSKLLDTKGITTEEFLENSLPIVAGGFKYPTNTVVSMTIRDQTASHPNFVMTPWSLSSDIKVNSEAAGKITVCYLEEKGEEDIGPFFREEKQLLHEMATKIGRHFERREGMNALLLAKEKAEAGDRLKTAFIQNISHEVRTPLNGIMGFSSLLGQSDLEEEDKQQFISLLKLSSERLLGTITDYMDISMLSSGTMEPHWSTVMVKHELVDLYDHFLPWFQNKNLRFNLQFPEKYSDLRIESDRTLFRKALQHVVGNALKFTHQGSVTVDLEVLPDQFDIVVKDTGIGVAEEALSRIFKLFEQEEQTRTRRYEGSGLGLPITWGILDLLGGKIHLDSVKGKGTTVRISFPFDCKEERLGDEVLFSTGTMKLPVILIVEDDLGNRFLLEKILADSSSRLLQASNGIEAVEICRHNPEIDIVLMDLRMPGQDGITTMLQIREIYPNLPVVAVTAYALSVEADRIMEAGCNDIISKPIQKKELIAKIKQVLG